MYQLLIILAPLRRNLLYIGGIIIFTCSRANLNRVAGKAGHKISRLHQVRDPANGVTAAHDNFRVCVRKIGPLRWN